MVKELSDKHLAAINRGRKAVGLKPIRRNKKTKEIIDYQKDVKAAQDAKDQAELEAAMKVQQGIMQQNIRDTFRIETEKLRAELEAEQLRAELETIPQDEPLQILNEVQHIEPEIIETSTKSNNSKYFIIGGIAIAAIVLFLILRRRK